MSVTGMAMTLVCAGSVTFLLSVLLALIREAMSGPPWAVKALLAKFIPPRKLGKLIVMDPKTLEKASKSPSRIALVALAVLGLSLSTHSQKRLTGSSVSNGNGAVAGV